MKKNLLDTNAYFRTINRTGCGILRMHMVRIFTGHRMGRNQVARGPY